MAPENLTQDETDEPHDKPSKSEKKRESKAIVDLGAELVELRKEDLDAMPLAEEIREAVGLARRLKKGARKRQIKYVGKLLRAGDVELVRQALGQVKNRGRAAAQQSHLVERWRERLLGGGDDALQELLEDHPGADRQRLRQLVLQAQREKELGRPPRAYRQIFKALLDVLSRDDGR